MNARQGIDHLGPAEIGLKTLARLMAWRWPTENVIEEGQREWGLDHDEVRGWTGGPCHTAMTMLAPRLVRRRIELGEAAPALLVARVRRLL